MIRNTQLPRVPIVTARNIFTACITLSDSSVILVHFISSVVIPGRNSLSRNVRNHILVVNNSVLVWEHTV